MKAKRLLSALIALVMVLALVPAMSFAAETHRDAPEGYDEYEFTKMSAFLAIENARGETNASKLGADVDPADPTTWGYSILWNDGHITHISFPYSELYGDLDVSGFTQLDMLQCGNNELTSIDASNCPALTMLDCVECPQLTALNVTGSPLIQDLQCGMCAIESLDLSDDHSALNIGLDVSDNNLSFLDVSGCTEMPYLLCNDNNLTELDLSACTALNSFSCFDNPMKTVTVNPEMFGFEKIMAVGNGTFNAYDFVGDRPDLWHLATPDDGYEFLGWYDEEGNLLSEEADWTVPEEMLDSLPSTFIAKFTDDEPLTHEVVFKDWDGTVIDTQTVNDGEAAVAPEDPVREGYTFIGWDVDFSNVTEDLVVTAQYEVNGLPVTLLGDVNCDGKVDSTDALLAMRYSMNLAEISEQGFVNGDMNGDGSVNATDAVLIMRHAMAGN